ncbi:MAG: hypothetical protein ACREDR_03200 [Blastocatellia bacterium]
MRKGFDLKGRQEAGVRSFLLEIAVYAVLIVAYFYVVLFFLGSHVNNLFLENKWAYAAASLALIIGQGVALESVTTFLLKFVKKDSE